MPNPRFSRSIAYSFDVRVDQDRNPNSSVLTRGTFNSFMFKKDTLLCLVGQGECASKIG